MSIYNKTDQICNICRTSCELSEDHVPPKGVLLNRSVWMDNYGKIYQKNDQKPRIRLSQNGIRFKTICHLCNNRLHDYDRKLVEFSINVINALKNSSDQTNEIVVDCYPSAIMRSILGHLLAAKVETDKVVSDEIIRSFILNSKSSISEKIHVYYWLYPFYSVRIARDFVRFFNGRCGFNSVIKFPPLGFLISDLPQCDNLPNFDLFKTKDANYKYQIKINMTLLKREGWPEEVGDDNPVIAGGKSFCNSLTATPKI